MRNQYAYLALVCSLSAMLLCFNIAPAIGKQSSSAKKRSIWVAVTNIRKGEKIQKGMIVRKMISEREFSNGDIEFSWLIIAKRPFFNLPRRKIIQVDDFFDLKGINIYSIFTTKAILAGARFEKTDLRVVQSVFYSRVPSFPPRPTKISAVVGKKARTNLAASHKLLNRDIMP